MFVPVFHYLIHMVSPTLSQVLVHFSIFKLRSMYVHLRYIIPFIASLNIFSIIWNCCSSQFPTTRACMPYVSHPYHLQGPYYVYIRIFETTCLCYDFQNVPLYTLRRYLNSWLCYIHIIELIIHPLHNFDQ